MAISPLHTALAAGKLAMLASGVALLALLSAGGYGIHCVRRCWGPTGLAEEEGVLAAALGFGIISLLMAIAGLCHLWTRGGAWVILAIGVLVSGPFLSCVKRFTFQRRLAPNRTAVILFLCILWSFLLALAPVVYYDSLVYHFALPAAYIQAGRWVGLQPLIYSAFPQTMEMLWTFGVLLLSDTVANLIGFLLALLLAGATACFAARFLKKDMAPVAVILLMSMPAFLLLSSGGYVDIGLTLYSFLSLYALFMWRNTAWRAPLLLSGLFAGLAMGTKYTGGISFAAEGILILWSARRHPMLALQSVLIYSGAALAVFSPWLIKNSFYTGNPVFPFFYQWGSSRLNPWSQVAAAGYFRGVAEYKPHTLLGLVRLPWEIIVHSVRFGGGMDVLGDFGWIPFIILLPCLGFVRRRVAGTDWLVSYALLFFLVWGMTRPVLRFLMPLAPALALLSAIAWSQGVGQWKLELRRSAKRVIGAVLIYDFFMFFYAASILGSFPVALGLQSRDTYLRAKLNYYAAARALDHLAHVRKVFVLGDQRGYYYNAPVSVSPVFNENPFVTWANGSATPQELRMKLRAGGFSHLLINRLEMARLAPYGIFNFTPRGLANWKRLREKGDREVYSDSACEILAL